MQRWSEVYGEVRRGEMQIVAAAAALHRLISLHPFIEGNGQGARLQTLAVLQSIDLVPGLWSPPRGAEQMGERRLRMEALRPLHYLFATQGRLGHCGRCRSGGATASGWLLPVTLHA